MAAIDQNKTEEKALKYASFCDHDDQMIEAVVGSGYFVLVARRTHYLTVLESFQQHGSLHLLP